MRGDRFRANLFSGLTTRPQKRAGCTPVCWVSRLPVIAAASGGTGQYWQPRILGGHVILRAITTARHGLPTWEDDMTVTDQERRDLLQRRITYALRDVRDAREAYLRCPSGERQRDIDDAEAHLDTLLADQRLPRQREGATT